MRQRGELEQQKYKIMTLARKAIRARHAADADDEINEYLPALEARLDALEPGEVFELDVKSILEGS
jgi:hypothetical protein